PPPGRPARPERPKTGSSACAATHAGPPAAPERPKTWRSATAASRARDNCQSSSDVPGGRWRDFCAGSAIVFFEEGVESFDEAVGGFEHGVVAQAVEPGEGRAGALLVELLGDGWHGDRVGASPDQVGGAVELGPGADPAV